ncbi:hypothetical protein M5K25_016351 [Dendrobium thyrsiflorum]|uniref:Uncharacterized protein n=1 Tax=Dendrobium thyrsiflorum TaxID=117978 RepID=A0ABD0UJT4_DENTH
MRQNSVDFRDCSKFCNSDKGSQSFLQQETEQVQSVAERNSGRQNRRGFGLTYKRRNVGDTGLEKTAHQESQSSQPIRISEDPENVALVEGSAPSIDPTSVGMDAMNAMLGNMMQLQMMEMMQSLVGSATPGVLPVVTPVTPTTPGSSINVEASLRDSLRQPLIPLRIKEFSERVESARILENDIEVVKQKWENNDRKRQSDHKGGSTKRQKFQQSQHQQFMRLPAIPLTKRLYTSLSSHPSLFGFSRSRAGRRSGLLRAGPMAAGENQQLSHLPTPSSTYLPWPAPNIRYPHLTCSAFREVTCSSPFASSQ